MNSAPSDPGVPTPPRSTQSTDSDQIPECLHGPECPGARTDCGAPDDVTPRADRFYREPPCGPNPSPERPSDYVRGLLDAAQIVADSAEQGLGLAAAERAIRREA